AGGGPFAVVRAIVDTPDHPLWRPGTVIRGFRALRALRRAAPAIAPWAAAAHEREVLIAGPDPADPQLSGADLVLVLDSPRPSGRHDARLVRDAAEVDLRWLAGAHRIGIAADASAAPPHLVDDLVRTLTGLGPIRFTMPREVT